MSVHNGLDNNLREWRILEKGWEYDILESKDFYQVTLNLNGSDIKVFLSSTNKATALALARKIIIKFADINSIDFDFEKYDCVLTNLQE